MAIHKIDVGKDAKLNGSLHPKHVPIPDDRVTPKLFPRRKTHKPFGYRYETSWCGGEWKWRRRWFDKAAHRDQSFEKEERYHAGRTNSGILRYRNLHKTERML